MDSIILTIFSSIIMCYLFYLVGKRACKNAIRDHLPEIKAYIKMVERNEEINKNQK